MPFKGSNLFSADAVADCHDGNDEMAHLLDLGHDGQDHYASTMAAVEDEYDTDEDDLTTPVLEKSAENQHKALSLLWVSQLMGWCSMCSVVLFWTSFISIDIYHGVPAPDDPSRALEWGQFRA